MTDYKVEHQAKGKTYCITLIERETEDGSEWSFHYISQNTINGRQHPKPKGQNGFSTRREAEEAAHVSISMYEI